MKYLLKLLTHRIFIIGLVILLELIIISILILNLTINFAATYTMIVVMAILLVIYIINRNDNPVYRFAWTLIILTFPPIGTVLYLLIGGRQVPKALREKLTDVYGDDDLLNIENDSILAEIDKKTPQWTRLLRYLINTSHFPVFGDTEAMYFSSGEEKFQILKQKLIEARHFIFLEYFIVKEGKVWDELISILAKKVKEGVEVRLLYDDWGAANFSDLQAECDAAGIKAVAFNPLVAKLVIQMNNRNHRKICVIDGRYGFVGGMNLADEYINIGSKFGHWKDTAVMIEGEAVHSLTLMFLQFWSYYTSTVEDSDRFRYEFESKKDESKGYVIPFADAPTDAYDISADTHLFLISNAKRYIYIQTPYLIIGYEMITALKMAAKSGVDVRIVVPHIPDKKLVNQVTKSNYEELTKHGVKIYEYKPGFVHSKTIVVDDELAIIGTTNMDYRSYYLHFECGIIFIDNHIVKDCYYETISTIENHCVEITYEDSLKVPFLLRLGRSILGLFSGLM